MPRQHFRRSRLGKNQVDQPRIWLEFLIADIRPRPQNQGRRAKRANLRSPFLEPIGIAGKEPLSMHDDQPRRAACTTYGSLSCSPEQSMRITPPAAGNASAMETTQGSLKSPKNQIAPGIRPSKSTASMPRPADPPGGSLVKEVKLAHVVKSGNATGELSVVSCQLSVVESAAIATPPERAPTGPTRSSTMDNGPRTTDTPARPEAKSVRSVQSDRSVRSAFQPPDGMVDQHVGELQIASPDSMQSMIATRSQNAR